MQEGDGDEDPGAGLQPGDGEAAQVEEEDGDFEEDLDEDVEEFHYEENLEVLCVVSMFLFSGSCLDFQGGDEWIY